MTKHDLIKEVADTAGIKKGQAEKIVNIVFNAIKRSLSKEESVSIVGFGTFSIVKIPSGKGWVPSLRKKTIIPEKQKMRFFPSSALYRDIYKKTDTEDNV